jgi:2-keto-4-pentenoate hydratase/2-oxohepta-3-ene-1,7-dioic acid hydratase in catechol pathway
MSERRYCAQHAAARHAVCPRSELCRSRQRAGLQAATEPLVFIKAPNTFNGDGQTSVRPNNIEYMHYEAELVVVIGKTARKVSEAEAMDYVAGYTVCNDYAIRDYLENYYRPNLRVKSRDGLTPISPTSCQKKPFPIRTTSPCAPSSTASCARKAPPPISFSASRT